MEKKRRTKETAWLAGCFLGALFTCFILDSTYFLQIPVLTKQGFSFSKETVIWLAVLMLLYRLACSCWEPRRILCSVLCGIVMSLMLLLGIRYSSNEKIGISLPRSICALAAGALLFSGVLSTLFRCLDEAGKRAAFCRREAKLSCKKQHVFFFSWFCLFGITMAVYLPVFFAVYPGIYSYDASIQVMQLFGVHPLTTHHPLLHSLYLFCCFKTGELLFHSYQAGMAMYALSQAVLMAAVFSLALCRMRKRGVPVWLLAGSWLFLVINPYVTVFSFVTTKDVVFGAFFLLLFDLSFDLMANPAVFLKSRRKCGQFFGSALFMCLFRNQGIYVYALFALGVLFLFFLEKKDGKTGEQLNKRSSVHLRFLTGSLLMAVLWYTCSAALPAAAGIEQGDSREMLCVPMQQLARVWTEEGESLTDEEKTYIETLIDPQALSQYVRVNADPVKSGFRTEVLRQDPKRFLSVWLSLGCQYPEIYVDSFCMGNWGVWYPFQSQYWIHYILFDGAFLEPEYNVLNIHRNSKLPIFEEKLRELTLTPVFDSVPVLSVLLNQAFPFWLMLSAGFWSVWKKRYANLVPLLLIFGYWGTLLLGPVTSLRYVLPLIYCVPRMAEMFVWQDNEKKAEPETEEL